MEYITTLTLKNNVVKYNKKCYYRIKCKNKIYWRKIWGKN